MFTIEMLPAEFGDALWIEYGEGAKPDPVHRVLVDCGTKTVYPTLRERIRALDANDRHFELFVVTHIDVDHIGGAVDLLGEAQALGVTFGEIWFNGFVHLTAGGRVPKPQADDVLGPLQGEQLTELIVGLGTRRWNAAAGGGAIALPDAGPVAPLVTLPGGMRLTVLSPGRNELDRLRPEWDAACRAAGIVPGAATSEDRKRLDEAGTPGEADDLLGEPTVAQLAAAKFTPDRAKPNGSSIALIAEYAGKRVLLAGDAYAPVVLAALGRLSGRTSGSASGRLALDVVKVSHHGSRNNTSLELVQAIACPHWLVSTNGKVFGHPDGEAIARIVTGAGAGVTVHFNYLTEFNQRWASAKTQRDNKYVAKYPKPGAQGILLPL